MTRGSGKTISTGTDVPLPDDVPVLVAADVWWQYARRDGSRDLATWLDDTFRPDAGGVDPPAYAAAYRELCRVLTERLGRPVTVLWLFMEFVAKHRSPPLAWQAACWNEALHRLGYDVPKAARRDPGLTA